MCLGASSHNIVRTTTPGSEGDSRGLVVLAIFFCGCNCFCKGGTSPEGKGFVSHVATFECIGSLDWI